MPEYDVSGMQFQHRRGVYAAGSTEEAVARFREQFPGFKVVEVNHRNVDASCEGCGRLLFDGDVFSTDCDSVSLCQKCEVAR